MGIRVYVSSPVLQGNKWRAKAGDYCTGGFVNIFPSKSDGSAATGWVLTIGRATDWTAADADDDLTPLLPPDYTDQFNTAPELMADLRTRTLAHLTAPQQDELRTWLDHHHVPSVDFTDATPLDQVFRRIVGRLLAEDESFAGDINF